MTDNARIARLTELARRVPCWKFYMRKGYTVVVERDAQGQMAAFAVDTEGNRWTLLDTFTDVDALEAALCTLAEEPDGDMLRELQQWWERHALALRATSRSVHQAIGVALSALEQGKPFPTMQVLCEPAGEASQPDDDIARIRRDWLDSKMPPQDLRIARRDIATLLEALNATTERAEAAEDVLRWLACYVSAGGYNADMVDAEVFREKIKWGIDHECDFWRKRAEQAELKLKLGQ
jgi:hypothetical protein